MVNLQLVNCKFVLQADAISSANTLDFQSFVHIVPQDDIIRILQVEPGSVLSTVQQKNLSVTVNVLVKILLSLIGRA